MSKINLTGVLNDATLNSIKELIGDEAYGKLATVEFESGEQKLIPISKFNEQAEQIKTYQNQIKDQSKQIEDLGKFKGTSEEKDAKIKELMDAQEKMQENFNTQMTTYKTNAAWEKALSGTGARNVNALKGMIDASKVTYDADKDTLVGFEEQVASIRKDNDWLFVNQVPTSAGVQHSNTPITNDEETKRLRKAFGLDN